MTRLPVTRLLCAGAAVALALLASARPASAGGSLLVTPVIIDQPIKKSGDVLPPIKVVNEGNEELDVSIMFNTLGHDRTGTPNTPPGTYKYNASSMLTATPNKFKLGAGKSVDVQVKVNIPGGRTGGAYSTMYVLGKPKPKPSESITSYIQVGVLIELVLPGAAKQRIAPGKVFAMQERPGLPVTLYAGANNQGDAHTKVGGTLVISNAKGAEVAKLSLQSANVLPLMSRDIKVTWKAPPTLAVGKYKLAATLQGAGVGNETALGTMEVIKPGELARTTAIVNKFQTPPVVRNKPIQLAATVANLGNTAFSPVGKVTFVDSKGNDVVAAVLRTATAIAPGQRGTIAGALPSGLPTGRYQVKLEVMNEADFVIANYTQTMQVIEKEVVLTAKIAKLTAPTQKEPFVNIEFANTGNTELDVEGVINVVDSGGNTVDTVPLEKKHVAVAGNTSYKRGVPAGLASGTYELRVVLGYGGTAPADKAVKYFAQ